MITTTILGLLGGSGGAFLSKIVDDFFQIKKKKAEDIHELEMNKFKIQQSKIDHTQEMEMRKFSLEETKEIKQIEFDQAEMEYSFKESMNVHDADAKVIGKDASFWDKVSKSVRPTFAYTFLSFFIITKVFLIIAFCLNGVWDTKTITSIASTIWDKDTQTVFFTVVGFFYTQRYFQNAQNYVNSKTPKSKGTKVRS